MAITPTNKHSQSIDFIVIRQECLVVGTLETIGMLLMGSYFFSQRRGKVQLIGTDIPFVDFCGSSKWKYRILAIFHIVVNDDVIICFGNLETILSAIAFCRKKNRYNKISYKTSYQ